MNFVPRCACIMVGLNFFRECLVIGSQAPIILSPGHTCTILRLCCTIPGCLQTLRTKSGLAHCQLCLLPVKPLTERYGDELNVQSAHQATRNGSLNKCLACIKRRECRATCTCTPYGVPREPHLCHVVAS